MLYTLRKAMFHLMNFRLLEMREVTFIALMLCHLFLQGHQAKFLSKPSEKVQATVGEDVTFNWTFTLGNHESLIMMTLYYSKSVQFESTKEIIAYRTNKGGLHVTDSSARMVTETDAGVLTLHSVTVANSGFYKCEVSIEGQARPIWRKTELLVGTAPVIHSIPEPQITIFDGDHVNISCEASGIPVPSVSWYRRTDSWSKISGSMIQIKNANLSDSGTYECRAKNEFNETRKKVNIVVNERPRIRSFFHTAALDNTVYECDAVSFVCETSRSSIPVKNFYIYHGRNLLYRNIDRTNSESRGLFTIAEIKRKHEGTYYCVVQNEYGFGHNRTISLTVYDGPENCPMKREILTEKRNTTRRIKTQRENPSPTTTGLNVNGRVSFWIATEIKQEIY
ncbi:hemicentin-1-like [Dendronephthya gigantea]|uniref:hemicentin-1-like n=1 Tax=Dendronephthya gigantea TaxID=151771 RepID=UPI00106DC9B5|nr:hemicentin-1-like [Dendronephthya gigantea]